MPVVSRMSTKDLLSFRRSIILCSIGILVNLLRIFHADAAWTSLAQFLSNKLGQPRQFVGLTGASNFNQFRRLLEEAKAAGIRRIMLAYDMDALTNETVQNARDRILKEGYDAGFEMTLLSWDSQYKGIDDLLHHFTIRYNKLRKLETA